MTEGAAFNVLIPTVDTRVFVHAATIENIISNYTLIDHPLTNQNPDAIVFVTQNWNPGDLGGTVNDHAIGVFYAGGPQKWGVFNQDLLAMPEGADFNVFVASEDLHTFVHTATVTNTSGSSTYIDHPLVDGNPCAMLLVTQNWNPGGGAGAYNDSPVGVWYDGSAEKWAIFNQQAGTSPEGAAFNVMVLVHRVYLPIVLRGT
jgi:hypothetical protein